MTSVTSIMLDVHCHSMWSFGDHRDSFKSLFEDWMAHPAKEPHFANRFRRWSIDSNPK